GANAEVSTDAVAIPLERAINGVAGMTSMNTVSTNNGTTLIQVFFEVGTDPDIAAVNVQNRVTTVLDELPEEVIRAGVTTEKEEIGRASRRDSGERSELAGAYKAESVDGDEDCASNT